MTWYEKIIAVHTAVTDAVSHGGRMKSDRYFVWQEDRRTDLNADGKHGLKIIIGATDLYSKLEFDPWAQIFEELLEKQIDISWAYVGTEYEERTGLWRQEWTWEIAE